MLPNTKRFGEAVVRYNGAFTMNPVEICVYLGKNLSPLFDCTPAPIEGVRVRTPMMYPDGGIVDVFVLERGEAYIVTDFGDALGWLQMQSVSRGLTKRQNTLVGDVCRTLRVELFEGQLVLREVKPEELGDAVMRLAQAVVRVSDVRFTMQPRRIKTTADEVEGWLEEKRIPFERRVKLQGQSDRDWTIDFRTETKRTAMIFLLDTSARSAVRRITENVLAGCVDLGYLKDRNPELTFVSLFNDSRDIWRDQDMRLVESHSEIARWSRPDTLERILLAT